jgi:cytochrome c5
MKMRRLKSWICAVVVLSCSSLAWLSAQKSSEQFPDGPGKSAFIKVCTQCHDVDKVAGLRYSREEWQSLVDEMRAMGGEATDDEWKTAVDYLARSFPRK